MHILWVLMDYNEPFSGGVERTFHDMISMCSDHNNDIYPVSMSNRKTIPPGSRIVSGVSRKRYDVVIIDGYPPVRPPAIALLDKCDRVIFKLQAANNETINATKDLGCDYIAYQYPHVSQPVVGEYYVLPPALDFKKWNFVGERGGDTFLYVGRVAKEKGIHRLLNYFYSDGPLGEFKLRILGWSNCPEETGEMNYLINRARNNGADIYFSEGFVDDARLVAEYSMARALIVPSATETFGHQILEALACGCPVITCFDEHCSSLDWLGKYVTQVRMRGIGNVIENNLLKDPMRFRPRLIEEFGFENIGRKLNFILSGGKFPDV